jgi:hypothetical protein
VAITAAPATAPMTPAITSFATIFAAMAVSSPIVLLKAYSKPADPASA